MGKEEHCKQISLACVGSAHSVSARLGLPPLTACMLSQSTLIRLQVALRGTGPGLCALPRSKPVRFRFLGTPQRCRLSWACVLCHFPVRAAQATRCIASTLSSGAVRLITSLVPAAQVSRSARLRCTMCLFWGADLWLRPSQRMSTVQNPRKSLVRNWKPVCSLVGDALSGAKFAPFLLWLVPACPLCPVGDGPVCSLLALLWYSLSPLFCERPGSALG